MTLQEQATNLIADADFRTAWPIETRKILVRAARTEGEMPAYAVKRVKAALAEARNIERRMERDIAQGQRNLSHADRKRLASR